MLSTVSKCKMGAQISQMHLNTSTTCFEGPRGRKIGLSDPARKIRFGGSIGNLARGGVGTPAFCRELLLSWRRLRCGPARHVLECGCKIAWDTTMHGQAYTQSRTMTECTHFTASEHIAVQKSVLMILDCSDVCDCCSDVG